MPCPVVYGENWALQKSCKMRFIRALDFWVNNIMTFALFQRCSSGLVHETNFVNRSDLSGWSFWSIPLVKEAHSDKVWMYHAVRSIKATAGSNECKHLFTPMSGRP